MAFTAVLLTASDVWRWMHGQPALHVSHSEDLSFFSVLSHIFLVHNWTRWAILFDPPLWTVATEFQIYFFFPLFLLPVRRKLGWLGCCVAGLALGFLPLAISSQESMRYVCPWYLGLFALGMAAADLGVNGKASSLSLRVFAGIGLLTTTAAALVLWKFGVKDWLFVGDTLFGTGAAAFLALCLRRAPALRLPLKLLEAKPLLWLGTFSYSIYLIHMPLLGKIYPITKSLHLSPVLEMMFYLTVVLAIVLATSFVFHLAFERPFLRRREKMSPPRRMALESAVP
jgi:peptidoglycan/LPS O-acetylase OafA/YrhL